mmetsp:Transcript_18674/g.47187  ORF Transcript_18674/g.47187 Transcript_18674/m.47187 type:complete len:214 (-) Transcript_18674:27-668(-)
MWVAAVQSASRFRMLYIDTAWGVKLVGVVKEVDRVVQRSGHSWADLTSLSSVLLTPLVEDVGWCVEVFCVRQENEGDYIMKNVRKRARLDAKLIKYVPHASTLEELGSAIQALVDSPSTSLHTCQLLSRPAFTRSRATGRRYPPPKGSQSGTSSSPHPPPVQAGKGRDSTSPSTFSPWSIVEDYGGVPDSELRSILSSLFGVQYNVDWCAEPR